MTKEDRNQEIITLREQGYSFVDIGKKYDISSTRARQIYSNYITRKELEKDELHIAISKLTDSDAIISKAYNFLYRNNIRSIAQLKDTPDKFLESRYGYGAKTKDIIQQIKNS